MQKYFQVLVFILTSQVLANNIYAQCSDPHPIYERLIKLYEQTGGENWTNNNGWKDGALGLSCDPCADGWFGINCVEIPSTDYFAYDINLPENNLIGEFPKEIFDLEGLRELILPNNFLTGDLPDSFQLWHSLDLDLSNNQLSGPLPKPIFNESKGKINLSHNGFTGEIPSDTKITNFSELNLSYNSLTGKIPDIDTSGFTSSGLHLDLSHNQLSDTIPSGIFNEPDYVDLSYNQLTGNIPSTLFLENNFLEYVDLSNNQLTGVIPFTIEDISFIEVLKLDHNQLEGGIHFNSLADSSSSLDTLDLSFNRFSGSIPDFAAGSGIIRYLNLRSNNLEGCVPIDILDIYCDWDIVFFDLAENPKLAFGGAEESICNLQSASTFEDQIGAPCDADGDPSSLESIQIDCSCAEDLINPYTSDTISLSQNGFNHQLIIHRTTSSTNDNVINVVNLFENESDIFFTGKDGVYRRKDGQIILDRLNPEGWYSYYLFPPTDWSISNEYARLFFDGLFEYDDREFDDFPPLVGTTMNNNSDLRNFLLSHNTYKTFKSQTYGSYSQIGEEVIGSSGSFIVMNDHEKSIRSNFGTSFNGSQNSFFYFANGVTRISHPINDFEKIINASSPNEIDLSTVEKPQTLLDGCFVGNEAILIGLPADSSILSYDPILDALIEVNWTADRWPIKMDAINDSPIFILEENGLQLGFQEQNSLDLSFIMDEIILNGFINEAKDIYVDKQNHIWIHHTDIESFEPIAEIILDPTIGLLSTQINTIEASTEILIYPNPTNGEIYVQLKEIDDSIDLAYKIYDPFGKCLQSGPLENNSISLTNLGVGIYNLELVSKNMRWFEKFAFVE